MAVLPLIPMLMLLLPMPFSNPLQTISHQAFVVRWCEDRCGDVHQDSNPAVIHVAESLTAEEDGCYDSSPEVSGEIGGDGVSSEALDYGGVGEADSVGDGGWGDKGISGVKAGPDHDANEAVDEKFEQEQVAEVGLLWVGEAAEDAGSAAVEDCGAVLGNIGFFERLDLRPVHSHQ